MFCYQLCIIIIIIIIINHAKIGDKWFMWLV